MWNEDFIVWNPALRRGGGACALTFLEVFQLERSMLFSLLDGFPAGGKRADLP